MTQEELLTLIDYYRTQGAPGDQQMLVALLREVQEAEGGILSQNAKAMITEAYGLKSSVLQVIFRRVPGLRTQDAPHQLEICGSCRAGVALRVWLEDTYQVKSGDISQIGGFFYRIVGCMKQCGRGPALRWDGTLYTQADKALVQKLITGAQTKE